MLNGIKVSQRNNCLVIYLSQLLLANERLVRNSWSPLIVVIKMLNHSIFWELAHACYTASIIFKINTLWQLMHKKYFCYTCHLVFFVEIHFLSKAVNFDFGCLIKKLFDIFVHVFLLNDSCIFSPRIWINSIYVTSSQDTQMTLFSKNSTRTIFLKIKTLGNEWHF